MSRLFLPAATNYLLDPRQISPWTIAHGGSHPPVYTLLSGGGGRIQYAGQAPDAGEWINLEARSAAGSFAAGDSATFSVELSGDVSAELTFRLFVVPVNNTGDAIDYTSTVNIAVGTAPARFSVTRAALPALTDSVIVYVAPMGFVAGIHMDVVVDRACVTKSSYPTPYFDGDTVDDNDSCAWTGDANESTSTRDGSSLVFTTADGFPDLGTLGTIAGTFAIPVAGDVSSWNYPYTCGPGSASTVLKDSLFGVRGQRYNGSTQKGTGFISTETWAADSRHSFVHRFPDNGTQQFNLDGTDASSVAQAGSYQTFLELYIGAASGQIGSNIHVGNLLFSPSTKPNAWVTAIQANSGAAFGNVYRLKREFMAPGDALWIGGENDNKLWTKGA